MRINSRVVGTTFRNNGKGLSQEQWAALNIGDPVRLIRDPFGGPMGCPHSDPHAVAVVHEKAGWLGYIPKDTARILVADLREHWEAGHRADITEVTGGTENKWNQGINVAVHLSENQECPF